MPKYGGPGRQRQKCIKRQCLRFSRILYTDDHLHNKAAVMQDDMVAELKAAGSSLPGDGLEQVSAMESGFTDVVTVQDKSAKLHPHELLDEWDSTPRAASLRQAAPPSSGARKRPVSSQPPPAKRGRFGRRAAGNGRKKQSRTAATSMKGGAKKTTRTRLSLSDFDGVAQV